MLEVSFYLNIESVRDFIDFAWYKANSASRIKYPCKRCVNMVYHHIILVKEHLLHYSMDKKYTCWIWYGEGDPNEVVRNDDDTEDNRMLLDLSNIMV